MVSKLKIALQYLLENPTKTPYAAAKFAKLASPSSIYNALTGNQEHLNANKHFRQALQRGAIAKQPCFICGAGKVEGHHFDYSTPLEVTWLCPAHHDQLHREVKEWTAQKTNMTRGVTTEEFTTIARAHRLRGRKTLAGCRLVLVDGLTAYRAAQSVKVSEAALSRALAKLRLPLCPLCHKPE